MTSLESKQHALLVQLEWRGAGRCPICAGKMQHDPGCELAAALAAAGTVENQPHGMPSGLKDIQTRYSEYNVPLCPTCGAKAIHISAISFTDRTRICQCDGARDEHDQQIQQHTWVINEQGVEV